MGRQSFDFVSPIDRASLRDQLAVSANSPDHLDLAEALRLAATTLTATAASVEAAAFRPLSLPYVATRVRAEAAVTFAALHEVIARCQSVTPATTRADELEDAE